MHILNIYFCEFGGFPNKFSSDTTSIMPCFSVASHFFRRRDCNKRRRRGKNANDDVWTLVAASLKFHGVIGVDLGKHAGNTKCDDGLD